MSDNVFQLFNLLQLNLIKNFLLNHFFKQNDVIKKDLPGIIESVKLFKVNINNNWPIF